MAPSRALIELVSVMCESVLVGAYAVLVGLLVYILASSRKASSTMHRILFSASIAMFIISVVHLGLVMQQFSAAVVPVGNFQTQIVLSVFQFVIGDMVLIWRVWVIWGKNYFIAAGPFIIMIIAAALTFNLATLTETRPFFTTAPVALIVANTSICTLLIAGRIWYMHHQIVKTAGPNSRSWQSSGYKGAMILIVESGSLYALTQLCSLILNHTNSPGLTVMLNLEIPMIGILPTLIVILVHFNLVPGNNDNRSQKVSASQPRRWDAGTGTAIETIQFQSHELKTTSDTTTTTFGQSTAHLALDKSVQESQQYTASADHAV